MIGNVWEWTADTFARYHDHEPKVNPSGSPRGTDKVKKGGSFLSDEEHSYRKPIYKMFRCIFNPEIA
jgi:sulfatase modifying factor 1